MANRQEDIAGSEGEACALKLDIDVGKESSAVASLYLDRPCVSTCSDSNRRIIIKSDVEIISHKCKFRCRIPLQR